MTHYTPYLCYLPPSLHQQLLDSLKVDNHQKNDLNLTNIQASEICIEDDVMINNADIFIEDDDDNLNEDSSDENQVMNINDAGEHEEGNPMSRYSRAT
ncbi:unnamed protein product [Rotaria sordida]|uniref:Uncharacterized protein n=1 Tax=Rotaria sordida TaxID=392033 RepID=A0A815NVN5_9BILA|nr:unnamed protein product [Rotaria sordida]CAF1635304.1 unnamed protein product [Rotaria sordida]